MQRSRELDDVVARAERRLQDVGGDFKALPWQLAVVLRVHGAQGIIDNGGLRYFFESNWEGTPPYSEFVDAYASIGASEVAASLERAVSQLFPFPDPHLDEVARRAAMGPPDLDSPVEQLDDICGDTSVYDKLMAFVGVHAAVFGGS